MTVRQPITVFGVLAIALAAAALAAQTASTAPFAGFPAVPTAARAGETVLAPSYNWIEEAAATGGAKTRFIFYHQLMVEPGQETSRVQFGRTTQAVANSYLVRIPKGGRAAVGDTVLTWWQSGSGMQRAFVTSAQDPARPVVRYLDLDYDNPALARDKSTTIGKMNETLAADSFVKLAAGDPGTVHRCLESGRPTRWRLVARASSGDMLMVGFVGRMQIFAKGACTATPLVPSVRVGQTVDVESNGAFTKAVVTRIDASIGRVFVTLFNKERAIAFGDVY